MPDIFFMFVMFAMLIVIWGGLIILHIIDKFTDLGKKAILASALAYVVGVFKK